MCWGALIFCIGAGLSAVAALVWVESGFGTPKVAGGAAALAGVGMVWFLVSVLRMRSIVGEAVKAAGGSTDLPMGLIWGFYVTAVVVLLACLVHFTAERE